MSLIGAVVWGNIRPRNEACFEIVEPVGWCLAGMEANLVTAGRFPVGNLHSPPGHPTPDAVDRVGLAARYRGSIHGARMIGSCLIGKRHMGME